MPWFRVDDGFYDHPKVRRAGNAAIGLWLRCGTWSARHLRDGRIPVEIVREFGKPREIEALANARMWSLDLDEYVMHDYLDYNPSAETVKQRRKKDAQRKRESAQSDAETGANARPYGDPFDD